MRTLLSNRYALALAALIAAGLVLHLMPTGRDDAEFVSDLFNIGHVVGFALLAWVLVRLVEAGRAAGGGPATRTEALLGRPGAAYLVAGGIALGLGVAAEAVQVISPRDASWDDVLRDASGAAAGLFGAYAAAAGRPVRRLAAFAAGALVVFAGIAEPGTKMLARGAAWARFPVLADFESRLELRLVDGLSARVARVPAPPGWPRSGHVARIDTRGRRRFEGIALGGWPRDWSGYETLSFTIAAERPSDVTLRVNDTRHDNRYDDRFNHAIEVGPEPREVRIPLADVRSAPRERALDLSQVAAATVFMVNPGETVIYLDRLRLE